MSYQAENARDKREAREQAGEQAAMVWVWTVDVHGYPAGRLEPRKSQECPAFTASDFEVRK